MQHIPDIPNVPNSTLKGIENALKEVDKYTKRVNFYNQNALGVSEIIRICEENKLQILDHKQKNDLVLSAM